MGATSSRATLKRQEIDPTTQKETSNTVTSEQHKKSTIRREIYLNQMLTQPGSVVLGTK